MCHHDFQQDVRFLPRSGCCSCVHACKNARHRFVLHILFLTLKKNEENDRCPSQFSFPHTSLNHISRILVKALVTVLHNGPRMRPVLKGSYANARTCARTRSTPIQGEHGLVRDRWTTLTMSIYELTLAHFYCHLHYTVRTAPCLPWAPIASV